MPSIVVTFDVSKFLKSNDLIELQLLNISIITEIEEVSNPLKFNEVSEMQLSNMLLTIVISYQ